jgi:predicted ATPase
MQGDSQRPRGNRARARERHVLRRIGHGFLLVPLGRVDAPAQVVERGLRDVHGERPDRTAIADASLVAGMVAAALGMVVHSNDPEPGIAAFLEGRRVRVVLDNCEQVISAAAALAKRIHLAAPKVCILATRREPLRVEGSTSIRDPLRSPDDTSSLTAAEALAFPAVQLFVERAAAAGSHLNLTDEDAAPSRPSVATSTGSRSPWNWPPAASLHTLSMELRSLAPSIR